MELTIQPYQLYIPDWQYVKDDFLMHLLTMNTQGDFADGHYGFVEINKERHNIYGYFAQESVENLVKYENKEPSPINEHPWVRTPFIIDTEQLYIYINKKNYSAKNLNHGRLLNRMELMLSEELNKAVKLIPLFTEVTKEDFKRLFYNNDNIIKEIKVSNLRGSYIMDGVDLHNPKKEFDYIRAESHNKYDAKILKLAYLEANESGNLSKSPTARAFIEGDGTVGEMIQYVNKNTGEVTTEYSKGDARIKIKVDTEIEDIHAVYNVIKTGLARNKNKISRFVTDEPGSLFPEY